MFVVNAFPRVTKISRNGNLLSLSVNYMFGCRELINLKNFLTQQKSLIHISFVIYRVEILQPNFFPMAKGHVGQRRKQRGAHRYTIYLFIGTRCLAQDPKGCPSLHHLSAHRDTLASVGPKGEPIATPSICSQGHVGKRSIQRGAHSYTIYLIIWTRWLAQDPKGSPSQYHLSVHSDTLTSIGPQ